MTEFRNDFAESIFRFKYAHEGCETWDKLARTLANDVCAGLVPPDVVDAIYEIIRDHKFFPGGRYLYYAGRPNRFWNNCYLFKAEEDTRQDWAEKSWQIENALMTGGGIGCDWSVYRPKGSIINRTGGQASGPIPKMEMINEMGRRVMQGGSRRSAIYASLDRSHADVHDFLKAKNWDEMPVGTSGLTYADVKAQDFNFPAPLDMTNISVNYKTDWLYDAQIVNEWHPPSDPKWVGDADDPVFMENVRQALRTGEPGFSFNFFDKENETLRNACTEVCSEDDGDVCNLGSINMANIENLQDMARVTHLATVFLLCGTVRADLPFEKIRQVREKNRRLGLGLMGVHEFLLKRGGKYEVNDDFRHYLEVYKGESDYASIIWSNFLDLNRPVAKRAIAPTGSIGILAGTTTGIEPLFAVAYRRRYLKNGTEWHYQYVVDGTANTIIEQYGVDPDKIETAMDLASDPERRIRFQADVQDYVDQSISSTINLPQWGTDLNNEDTVKPFAETLAKYAPRLRGFTCYPDGSRGGQPLTAVPYHYAKDNLGSEFREAIETHDICDISGKGGTCGS